MTFTGKFVLVYLSRTFSIHRTPEEGERYLSLTPHYHFHPLHRHLGISQVITVERLPLHIDSNRKPYIYLCNTYIHIYCIYIHIQTYIYIYIYIYIYMISITYTVEKKRKCSYNSYAIIRLSEISSLYLYALFRKFCTPLTQSQLRH